MDRSSLYMTLNALANGLFWCLIFWMVFVFAICSITAAASSMLERSLQATIEDVEPKMAYAKSMYNATQVRQQPAHALLSFESTLTIMRRAATHPVLRAAPKHDSGESVRGSCAAAEAPERHEWWLGLPHLLHGLVEADIPERPDMRL
jgi:hypothetical protein